MNKISIEELEQKIEAGEEVIDRYFDAGTTRVGTRHTILRRESNITPVEIPLSLIEELDGMARELGIDRDAVIKMMLRRSLDEHYIAKSHHRSNSLASP
jgi:hypothetical protein